MQVHLHSKCSPICVRWSRIMLPKKKHDRQRDQALAPSFRTLSQFKLLSKLAIIIQSITLSRRQMRWKKVPHCLSEGKLHFHLESIPLQNCISQKQYSFFLRIENLRRVRRQDTFWHLLTFAEKDLSPLLSTYGSK